MIKATVEWMHLNLSLKESFAKIEKADEALRNQIGQLQKQNIMLATQAKLQAEKIRHLEQMVSHLTGMFAEERRHDRRPKQLAHDGPRVGDGNSKAE